MSRSASALYAGRVTHVRLRPRRHRLAYDFFWLLLDLDELAALPRRLKIFSHNRFNLFAFHDRDHLAGSGDLRPQIRTLLADAGIEAGGAIRILCLPRILGYGFNPVSLFFCYDPSEKLRAVLYEVNNTFGQRHSYLFRIEGEPPYAHGCEKQFYVSPFLQMDMRYHFRLTEPGARQQLAIEGHAAEGLMIAAKFTAGREELSTGRLVARLFTHPLLTLKVILGIHAEALLLLLKGVRLVPRPQPPISAVTDVKEG